ncbi:hypothetical protein FRB99_005293 [Tulasnella sp. 403]|nr:hypothetical protein FRB99_005293 [Tulasnella sp. 403]
MVSVTVLGCAAAVIGSTMARPSTMNVAGAAYFITNDPNENMVVSARIAKDGTLSAGSVASAGGRGGHIMSANPAAGDPLTSQGAVEVLGHHLFTVNAGSNSVAMFNIDAHDPSKLTMVGQPVPSGGEFPVSVAASKNGHVCVLNGGAVSNVNCFKVDSGRGLLPMQDSIRSLPLNQTTPPGGATASQIAFSPTGTKLFAAIKGAAPAPGWIATWTVASGGTLSKNFVRNNGGVTPFSITWIPGANAIFNADPGAGGLNIWDFSHTPAKVANTTIPQQGANCWSSFSPASGSFFLSDPGRAVLSELTVDKTLKPKLIQQYALPMGSGNLDIAVGSVCGHDFLYAMSAAAPAISVVSLKGRGKGTVVQNFNLTDIAMSANVSISSTNLQGMATYTM